MLGVAGPSREAFAGEALAGERNALRIRDGEGETGSRGSAARVCFPGPAGVVVRASDELGGVGRPPGAFRFACISFATSVLEDGGGADFGSSCVCSRGSGLLSEAIAERLNGLGRMLLEAAGKPSVGSGKL